MLELIHFCFLWVAYLGKQYNLYHALKMLHNMLHKIKAYYIVNGKLIEYELSI